MIRPYSCKNLQPEYFSLCPLVQRNGRIPGLSLWLEVWISTASGVSLSCLSLWQGYFCTIGHKKTNASSAITYK